MPKIKIPAFVTCFEVVIAQISSTKVAEKAKTTKPLAGPILGMHREVGRSQTPSRCLLVRQFESSVLFYKPVVCVCDFFC